MSEFRSRKAEYLCPKCSSNAKMRGGYLVRHNNVIMQRQYRECEVCGTKIITYKDLATKKVIFGKTQN